MLHLAVRPADLTRPARSLNWGISSAAWMSWKNTCAVTSTSAPGPVAVGWLADGEVRQQGVEFVVRQARDDLPGERDRVDEVDAG
jgi:hypothetical protein